MRLFFGGAGAMHTARSTSYYATFQVESGDRMDFHVSGAEYGHAGERRCGEAHVSGNAVSWI